LFMSGPPSFHVSVYPWSQMSITFSERASERPSVVVLPSDAAP
jgi:hypothetical protein